MLSVIIPVHNREENIRYTLWALSAQTLDPILFEVIVVDDSSTDNTKRTAEAIGRELDIQVTVVTCPKKDAWNASVPRNYGVEISNPSFEVIVFLDSDVLLNRDALQYYYDDYKKNPDRVVIGQYNWLPRMALDRETIQNNLNKIIACDMPKLPIEGGMGHIGQDVRKLSFEKATSPDLLFDTIYDGLACFGGNLMIPKAIFKKAGGYDETMRYGIEDGDFGLTLHEHGVKFSYDVRTIGYHHWHKLSAERAQQAGAEVKKLNEKHFKNKTIENISYATGIAYKRWGIDWYPPDFNEWSEEEKQRYGAKLREEISSKEVQNVN